MPETVEKILLQLDLEKNKAISGLDETKEKLKGLKDEQELLNKQLAEAEILHGKESASYKNIARELEINKQSVKAATSEQKSFEKQIELTIKANNAETGSLNQKRSALNAAQRQYDAMSTEMKKNDAETIALGKHIATLRAELTKEESDLKNFTRNVGNYTGALGGFKDRLGGLGKQVLAVASVGAVLQAGKAAVALAQEVEKEENKLFVALDRKKNIQEALIGQADALEKSTGVDDRAIVAQQTFLALQGRSQDQIEKTIQAAIRLSKTTGEDLDSSVKKLDATFEGSVGKLGKLDSAFNDLTEGQLAAGGAIDLINTKYKDTLDLQTENQKATNDYNNSIEDLEKAFGALVLKATPLLNVLTGVAEGFLNLTKSSADFEKALNIELTAEHKKKALDSFKSLRDDFIKEGDDFATATNKALQSKVREAAALSASSQERGAYKQTLLYQAELAAIGEFAKSDLEALAANEQKKNEAAEKASAERKKIRDKEEAEAKKIRDQETKEFDEFFSHLLDEEQVRIETDERRKAREQKEHDEQVKKNVDRINQVNEVNQAIDELNRDRFDNQRQILDEQEAELVSRAANNESQILAIHQAYAKLRSQVDEEEASEHLDRTKTAANSIAQVFSKQTVAYKALASATTLIDTYQAAIAAYKSAVVVPVIGPVLGPAAAAAAILAGFKSIAAINSVSIPAAQQFYEGGEYGGYTGDGSPRSRSLRVGPKPYIYHNKEYIIDHKTYAVPAVRSFVETVIEPTRREHQPVYPSSSGYITGGLFSGQSSTLDTSSIEAIVTNTVEQTMLRFPPIYTRITDIENGSSLKARIVGGANI